MPDLETSTDAELLTAIREGDRRAFAETYDRYSDRIYSYCLNRLRSPNEASAATQDTFVEMVAGIDDLGDASRLLVSLFVIARDQIRSRGGHRGGITARGDLVETLTQNLSVDYGRAALMVQVWEAIDALGERDQEVMALHLFEGLGGEDLADVMSLESTYVDDLVARVENRVQPTIGPLLIARVGSEECGELENVLEDWDGEFTPEVRARVARHIGRCETCYVERAFLTAPGNVLAVIMGVSAPKSLRDSVTSAVSDMIVPSDDVESMPAPVSESPAVAEAPPIRPSFSNPPPRRDTGLEDRAKLFVFAGVTVVFGLIGMAVSGQFEPPTGPSITNSAESSAHPGTSTTASPIAVPVPSTQGQGTAGPAPTSTPATPGMIETSTDAIAFGDEGTDAEFQIDNTGGRPIEFTVTPSADAIVLSSGGQVLQPGESVTYRVLLDREAVSEGEIGESITVDWDGETTEITVTATQMDDPILHNPQASPPTVQVDGCANSMTTISVRVRDRSPLASVVVRWSPDGGGTNETSMDGVGGDIFEARIGPFRSPQTASVRMVATDELGNAGGTTIPVEVVACS